MKTDLSRQEFISELTQNHSINLLALLLKFKKKLSRNTFFVNNLFKFFSTFLVALLGIATSSAINRLYGAEQYGLLIMVFVVTGFASSFAHLGTKPTLNRIIPKMSPHVDKKEEITHAVCSAIIMLLVGCFSLALILYLFGPLLQAFYQKSSLLPLLTISIFYFIAFSCVDFFLALFPDIQAV